MEDKKFRTSRGQLAEAEEVITNLLAAVEHLLDTSLSQENIELIKQIRSTRGALLGSIFPRDDVDIAYHCAYKHMLLAKMQMKEVIQSKITEGQKPYDDEIVLDGIKDSLGKIRAKYMNIPLSKLEDPGCMKCLEDYLMGEEDNQNVTEEVSP